VDFYLKNYEKERKKRKRTLAQRSQSTRSFPAAPKDIDAAGALMRLPLLPAQMPSWSRHR
ncbi:hypothetical protein KAR48_06185, partial [bacterium]|nr:hypothetical protein [bacterium]